MPTDFEGLLAVLADHSVDFVVIGGVALRLHGSGRTTEDLGISSRFPAGQPFRWVLKKASVRAQASLAASSR